ncbi:MAG: LacI family DNA-binding transcriptional regulator [Catonella sp.]
MEKNTTLKDIADKLGISVSTVSRVINGNSVKAANSKLQDKIWQTAKELNYVPNTAAQLLKRSRETDRDSLRTIACVFARADTDQSDPFFSEISRALETELLRQGFIMKYSIYNKGLPQAVLETFLKNEKVDGVIILGRPDKKIINLVCKYNKYVVYVGLNKIDGDIDQVICDGYEAGMLALKHLESIGIRKIFYLGETKSEARYKAYKDFMRQRGFSREVDDYTIESSFRLQTAYDKMKIFLKKKILPEGLFCGNDLAALGAIKALTEENIKIPKDISVIGIDDIAMAGFSVPMLTTVSIPKEQLGKKAAKFIVDRILNGNDINVIMMIPFKLVMRESTRK